MIQYVVSISIFLKGIVPNIDCGRVSYVVKYSMLTQERGERNDYKRTKQTRQ